MAKLIYSAITSLDGYTADAHGGFDWAEPDEEVHAFVNDLQRTVGTYLYGRRMYRTMSYWEDPPGLSDSPGVYQDFTDIWQAAEKVVYSRTLDAVSTARTRLEREFEPGAVRALKASAERDVTVAGAHLAAAAVKAGLVDELQLFLAPVVIGGGTRSLPDGVRLELELLDERRFANGMAYLQYRVVGDASPAA